MTPGGIVRRRTRTGAASVRALPGALMGRAVQSERSSRPVSTTAGADQGERAPSSPATRTRQVTRSREASGATGQGTNVEAGPSRIAVSVVVPSAVVRAISISARAWAQSAGAAGTSHDREGAARVPPSTSTSGRWWSTRRRTGATSGPTGSADKGAGSVSSSIAGMAGMRSSGSSLNRFMNGLGSD